MYALREACLELLEEGVHNRISHYQTIATTLRDGLASLELDLLVPRDLLSNTMTTVMLPGWMDLSGAARAAQEPWLRYIQVPESF